MTWDDPYDDYAAEDYRQNDGRELTEILEGDPILFERPEQRFGYQAKDVLRELHWRIRNGRGRVIPSKLTQDNFHLFEPPIKETVCIGRIGHLPEEGD
jgi:hypothetical protein